MLESKFRGKLSMKKIWKICEILDVKTPYKKFHVDIGTCVGQNDRVWTLAMNTEIDHKAHVPMVLLHGYVSALAFWLLNLDGKSAVYIELFAIN